MTFILGLTGSIGMGKSTTALMFADAGIPVWDADAAVHRLYSENTDLIAEIETLVPGSSSAEGVQRNALKAAISKDPGALKAIEAAVAPYVAKDRDDFLARSTSDITLIDHPLLFESGTAKLCHATLTVTTDAATQRERVLARGTMTAEMLDTILAKQMPDSQKRAQADYIIYTTDRQSARKQVHQVIRHIRSRHYA